MSVVLAVNDRRNTFGRSCGFWCINLTCAIVLAFQTGKPVEQGDLPRTVPLTLSEIESNSWRLQLGCHPSPVLFGVGFSLVSYFFACWVVCRQLFICATGRTESGIRAFNRKTQFAIGVEDFRCCCCCRPRCYRLELPSYCSLSSAVIRHAAKLAALFDPTTWPSDPNRSRSSIPRSFYTRS